MKLQKNPSAQSDKQPPQLSTQSLRKVDTQEENILEGVKDLPIVSPMLTKVIERGLILLRVLS